MIFKKIWISATEYRIEQIREDGRTRYVDEDYGQYVDWLNQGNIPEAVEYVAPALPTTEEIWETVRQQRNELLLSCDYTQLSDVPLTEKEKGAWQTYRQALRDITTQLDPCHITWPIVPRP